MNRFSLILLALLAFAMPAFAQGELTVIHGIKGGDLGLDPALPVDVNVNGGNLLAGFTFGQIEGPLDLPAGSYDISIRLADALNPGTGAEVIFVTISLADGENATAIAHLAADGTPTATKFTNDTSPYGWRRARLSLAHCAAAPLVDIDLRRFGRQITDSTIPNVPNAAQASDDVLFGSWSATVRVAGTNTVALGPAFGLLAPFRTYRVYVVGSASNGSLDLIVDRRR